MLHSSLKFLVVKFFLWTSLLLLRETWAAEEASTTEDVGGGVRGSFPIVMPRVKPKLPRGESYLCTAVKVSEATDPLYVSMIEPLANMETVHHMLVVGCSNPVHGGHSNGKNLWNCGGSLGEEGLAYSSPCRKSKQVREL